MSDNKKHDRGSGLDPNGLRPDGPNSRRSLIVTLVMIAALCYAVYTGYGAFNGKPSADVMSTNEFVTAVKQDRIESVTYKTEDGSLSGTYWRHKADVGEKNKASRFKSYYVGADSLQELMAKQPDTKFTIDTSSSDF